MEIFDAIYAMVAFGLFVLLSSVIQNGIFIITRGETYERPDGKKRDIHDMIAYWFYKLIMREAQPPEKVYYTGEALEALMRRIHKALPLPGHSSIENGQVLFVQPKVELKDLLHHPAVVDWLHNEDVFVDVSVVPYGGSNRTALELYTEQKRYVLSKYLRKPLVECLKCYPSIWGSLLYWPAVLWWFSGFSTWQLAVWIPYLLACSYVNFWLFRRTA